MRRLILAVVMALALPWLASAQSGVGGGQSGVGGGGQPQIGSGAPSGTCPANGLYVDTASGDFYDCLAGTWTKVGSAGGAGANTALSNLAAVAINAALLPGTTNSIALGDATHRWTNLFTTTFNCGIAGTTGCVLTGNGATSGAGTITFPPVGGTSTSPFSFSNVLTSPNGTATAVAYGFNGNQGLGLFSDGTRFGLSNFATWIFGSASSGMVAANNQSIGFPSANALGNNADTAISRSAANVLAVGNGTAGDTTGKVKSSGYMSVGTKFTASGCSNTTTVGGATGGHFTSGTTGTCTVTITMGDSATAPNAWVCDAHDVTTVADVITQTSTLSATQCTISGTTASGDVIVFTAQGH